MSLITRFVTAYRVATQKELYNSLGAVVRNFTPDDRYDPKNNTRGITYKAIDKIGTSAARYMPIIKDARDKPLASHPLLALVDKPNPRDNKTDFIHLWAMQRLIWGETFWYLARGERTQKVKEVYLLNPQSVELVVHQGEIQGYVLHKADGSRLPLEVDEVYHEKRPNPFNEWRGMSIVEQAAVYSNTEIISSDFTLNYLRNSASPSGIVQLPNMTPEAFKQFAAQWRENYEGPRNAGKTAFVRGEGVDFKAVGATLKDIDQKVTRDMAKEDVLMMLELPKAILGVIENSGLGRANVETIYYIFNKEVINPLHERLDDIWTDIAKMGGIFVKEARSLDHKSVVPEDEEAKLARQKSAVNRWMTVDEVRALDGLEPLPNGAGAILVPENALPTSQTKAAKKVVIKKSVSKAEARKTEQEQQEELRMKVVSLAETYSTAVKGEIAKFAAKQEAMVIGNLNASTKAFEDITYNAKEESEALALLLIPLFIELMNEQASGVANFITGEAVKITPEIRAQVEVFIKQIAGVYNTDTLAALEATLSQGVSNGESLVKLKRRIEQVYTDAKGYRAERIARTESLRASNLAAELTYKESGYTTVRWFVNPDACPFCKTFEGRTKTIGSSFVKVGDVVTTEAGDQMKIDYADIETPPLHPQCRCSLVPED